MGRIDVYEYDEICGAQWVGRFDNASAETFVSAASPQTPCWDTRSATRPSTAETREVKELHRTEDGQWVRHEWVGVQHSKDGPNRPTKCWYISGEEARQWLLTEGHHDAVEKYFGKPGEARPAVGGRPAIGPKRKVNLSEQTLARVAAYRERNPKGNKTMPEAEALRLLIEAGLDLWEKTAYLKEMEQEGNNQRIADLPVGRTAYTVPWAMFLDPEGRVWLNPEKSISESKSGTVEVRISRGTDGFRVWAPSTFNPRRLLVGVKAAAEGSLPVVRTNFEVPR
ncbi:hypothetical protein [Streptomyces sp. 5-10]|uniref:hypothetical protein n=1 Tax=Streptomyces sp. 5-10 TaxID=878925 RepID=UPI00168B78E4|nr:hypothetical protein [Streptomyces sp. 5-10]MBD3004897.1 hypothetical protein [Streptomyces sp. 5-10]